MPIDLDRRTVAAGLAAGAAAIALPVSPAAAAGPLLKTIPSTGETIPAVGLGTWITFNVGDDRTLRDESVAVMEAFFAGGGRMIDSSPMYGSAQPVIGYGLKKLGAPKTLFSAEKVWTSSSAAAQIQETQRFWGVPSFDLLQVHNLLAWERNLDLLAEMKEQKRLRYLGITTSEGRRHDEFAKVMETRPLDFVQLTYNPVDREVERRILPIARERGIAVIVNRPFRQGDLTEALEGQELPGFAAELNATTWAQLVLKFIVSHPAVAVAIPATSSVEHVRENLAAAAGPMPDEAMRARIAAAVAKA